MSLYCFIIWHLKQDYILIKLRSMIFPIKTSMFCIFEETLKVVVLLLNREPLPSRRFGFKTDEVRGLDSTSYLHIGRRNGIGNAISLPSLRIKRTSLRVYILRIVINLAIPTPRRYPAKVRRLVPKGTQVRRKINPGHLSFHAPAEPAEQKYLLTRLPPVCLGAVSRWHRVAGEWERVGVVEVDGNWCVAEDCFWHAADDVNV